MDESPLQLVSEIGDHLGRAARPNKDSLVKSLRQAASALSQIEQPPSQEAPRKLETTMKVVAAMKPLKKSIVKHGLLRHSDKDVKLLVAICVSELFRVLAPEPPFEDKYLRDVFKLILSMFAELGDIANPYFSRRVKILETVAQCKCCVIMLDIDCNDLVLDMFNVFFSVVREQHQQNLINDILSIMIHILNEETSQQLVNVILRNLVKEGKGAPPAASKLAVSVIQSCADKLEPFVCGFLTSCSLDGDSFENELKEFYHEILFKVFQCAPQMLIAVMPCLTQELLTDQVDVRIKAVNLVGKLLALPEHHVAKKYRNLFIEFKNRLSDKSTEVRLNTLQCAKACYLANPDGKESCEILNAIEGRLLDFDDRVRMQVLIVVCDLARSNLKLLLPELILKVTDRLWDKKISVRKKALQKLMELYRHYCDKCCEGHTSTIDQFEQIPCRVLMLCFDKDCKEFRPQSMEIILADDLFPDALSFEERTRHWIHIFSLFTPLHIKALNFVLSQKQRLQTEMQTYLSCRKRDKGNSTEEMQRRTKNLFMKMSASFPDPSQAEECFHKLNQMKDNNIFNSLELLLDELMIVKAWTSRDKFLKMIGDKHLYFQFLQLLSSKCSVNIFGVEHVRCIFDHLSSNGFVNEHLKFSSAKLLLTIVNIFPSLLRGSEEQFQILLEERSSVIDILIEILAKAGAHISVKSSNFYPFLENVCLEGTRVQAKHAVSAIASLVSSHQSIFSKLCKELVDSLYQGEKIPTVLQSLGCLAQHCVSAFEAQYEEIRSYIYTEIFQVEESDDPSSSDKSSECSDSCKLKIYGLKALVKSFLPHQGSLVKQKIEDLLEMLTKMLRTGDTFDGNTSSSSDKHHIKLAAAKSVLRLSRKWDLHISPETFRFTMMLAKDPSSFVRRSFLDKIHKLLMEHLLPCRYACAFALAGCCACKDTQDASCKYMEDYIKEHNRKAQFCRTSVVQGGLHTEYPAYMAVFLIHILAHDTDFPPEDCLNEELYAQLCSPLFWVIHALLNITFVNGDMGIINDTAMCLLTIFRAVKRAEDAVDAQQNPKLQILAEIGISIINALNLGKISISHAPSKIWLPSSLYRIGNDKHCDEANLKSLVQLPVDQDFIERVTHLLKSQVLVPASTLPKRVRKCQEGATWFVDGKKSHGRADMLAVGTTEVQKSTSQEVSLRRRQKRALSPTASELMSLCNEHSATEVQTNNAKKVTKAVQKKGKPSSCDSTFMKSSSSASQVPGQDVEKTVLSVNENSGKISGSVAELSKCQNTNVRESSSTKILDDGGDVEQLCLDSETWETVSHSSLGEKEDLSTELLKFSSNGDPRRCSSLKRLEKTVDASRGCPTKQSQHLAYKEHGKSSDGSTTFLVDRNKGRTVSDTSLSEVINMNKDVAVRRSRRLQKV